jgi:flagellar biosynthesis protein FlhB
MANFEDYPKNFLLAGLFVICMITFAVMLGNNYGQSEALMKSDQIDFSKLENQINQTSSDAQKWGEAFKSDNLFVATGTLVLFSIWGIGKLIWGSVTSFTTIFLDGASSVLGVSPIVTGVVMAILIISLIFALWKVIKAGE